MIDRLGFIVGHRSGTTLLLSLLDGHPEIAAYPNELKYKRRVLNALAGEAGQFRSELNRYFLRLQKVSSLGGFYQGGLGRFDLTNYDFNDFKRRLHSDESTVDDIASYLRHFARSFQYASGQHVFVLKHNQYDVGWYLEKFPDSKTIIMIRNPFDNYLSRLRWMTRVYGTKGFHPAHYDRTAFQQAFCMLVQMYEQAVEFKESDNVMIVRLDALVSEPLQVVNGICRFLEVSPIETIEQTILGKPFLGWSTRGRPKEVKQLSMTYDTTVTWFEQEAFSRYAHLFEEFYPNFLSTMSVDNTTEVLEERFGLGFLEARERGASWKNLQGILKKVWLFLCASRTVRRLWFSVEYRELIKTQFGTREKPGIDYYCQTSPQSLH